MYGSVHIVETLLEYEERKKKQKSVYKIRIVNEYLISIVSLLFFFGERNDRDDQGKKLTSNSQEPKKYNKNQRNWHQENNNSCVFMVGIGTHN